MNAGNVSIQIDQEKTPDDCIIVHIAIPGTVSAALKINKDLAFTLARDLLAPFGTIVKRSAGNDPQNPR